MKFLDVLSMLLHKYRERFGELGLKTEMKQATIALLDEIATVGAVMGDGIDEDVSPEAFSDQPAERISQRNHDRINRAGPDLSFEF